MCHCPEVRDARLWCRKSPEGSQIEHGFAIRQLENSVNCAVNVQRKERIHGLSLSAVVPKLYKATSLQQPPVGHQISGCCREVTAMERSNM